MRIFLAGATGVIGQRVSALLRQATHEGTGTTQNRQRAELRALGVTPVIVDVFDADTLSSAKARHELRFDPAFRMPENLIQKPRTF